jgi:hypothetical protein
VLAGFFGIAQLDREVGNDRESVEVDRRQRLNVVGGRELERRRVVEDFQSFGSIW